MALVERAARSPVPMPPLASEAVMLGQSWMFVLFVASGLLLVAVSMWPGPGRVEPESPQRLPASDPSPEGAAMTPDARDRCWVTAQFIVLLGASWLAVWGLFWLLLRLWGLWW